MDRKRQKCLSLVLPILKSSILSGYGYLTAVWSASQTGRDTFTLPGCAKAQKPVKGMSPHFCVGYGSIPPVAWEGNRGTCSDFHGQPRNCPPFQLPNLFVEIPCVPPSRVPNKSNNMFKNPPMINSSPHFPI